MKNRGTTALIALFFAGLLGLWAADRLRIPTAAERERRNPRILAELVDIKPDDLRKVEILGGPQPLAFERREGNRWQMTAPIDAAADPSLVEALAFRLKELRRKPQADTLADDPATYGLAPPDRRVLLWGRATDAPLARLEVSKANLDRRFVRADRDGAGVEAIPAQGLEVLDLPAIRWRDREVFRVPSFEVSDVQVDRPGTAAGPAGAEPARTLRLERGPDAWRIVEPFRTLADEAKVEGLIAGLGSLRITGDDQFVADNVPPAARERFGLDRPALTVRVAAGRGPGRRPDQVLHVGKPVPDRPGRVYALVGDQDDVITVDARPLEGLGGANPTSLRAEKVADFDGNRVTQFRVESGDSCYTVRRTGRGDWRLDDPGGRADPKAVQEFLKALDGLRTGIYLPPSPEADRTCGLERPAEVIKLWQVEAPAGRGGVGPGQASPGAAGEPRLVLELGRRDAGKKVFYARSGGDPTILALPEGAAGELLKPAWAFRDRLIVAVPADQVEQVRFDGLGKKVTIQAPPLKLNLAKNAPTGWWLSEPVYARADEAAVAKFLKLLASFRVDGYAADRPASLKPFGLDAPTLRVTWSVPAAPGSLADPSPLAAPGLAGPRPLRFEQQALLVGDEVPERKSMRYAMLEGYPVVFILGGETLATLDGEWHDHGVLAFPAEKVESIHLAWPGEGKTADLALHGDGWKFTGGTTIGGIEPEAAAGAVRAAAGLTTTRFTQYAGEIPGDLGLTPPRLTIRFEGTGLSQPAELALGGVLANGQAYAAAPRSQPGAVFLVDAKPFAAWLAARPAGTMRLPDDVFRRDPAPDATPDRPGQPGGEPR